MLAPVDQGRHRPAHLLLQWHITERCNLRCKHCYQEGKAAPELPLPRLPSVGKRT